MPGNNRNRRNNRNRKKRKQYGFYFDYTLLFVLVFIVGFGHQQLSDLRVMEVFRILLFGQAGV